jgi:hypothetical protein
VLRVSLWARVGHIVIAVTFLAAAKFLSSLYCMYVQLCGLLLDLCFPVWICHLELPWGTTMVMEHYFWRTNFVILYRKGEGEVLQHLRHISIEYSSREFRNCRLASCQVGCEIMSQFKMAGGVFLDSSITCEGHIRWYRTIWIIYEFDYFRKWIRYVR